MTKSSLATLTGGRYRIALDESWQREVDRKPEDKAWYERIPCQGGAFIGLYSLEPPILHLYTPRVKNAKTVWEAIKNIPGARADFHFDGEAELFFPMEGVHVVAGLAAARKKRRLSEEHMGRLAEAGKAHQFKPKIYGSKGEGNEADLSVFV